MKTASFGDKIAFLHQAASYGRDGQDVIAKETHASWVFLVGDTVWKIKKPIRLPGIDFTTLDARERNCREELRLNRRLAGDVYRDVVPLVQRGDGSLCLGGDGPAVDWLVVMRRLPADRMLDALLQENMLTPVQLNALSDVLGRFYRASARRDVKPDDVLRRFMDEQATNRQVLLAGRFDVDTETLRRLLDGLDDLFVRSKDDVATRVTVGRYVEGHGDLRPEHICFSDRVVIFDCLEFSSSLRIIDPFDEIAFLDVECRYTGADWVGPAVRRRLAELLQDDVPETLYRCYAAYRALLRARQALGHLHFGSSGDIRRWTEKTRRYADLARHFIDPGRGSGV